MEQKLMKEILSTIKEIEENPARQSAVPASFGKYWKLLSTILYVKKQRNIAIQTNKNPEKRRFPAYFRFFQQEKDFPQKSD